jgi:hypothetical protein
MVVTLKAKMTQTSSEKDKTEKIRHLIEAGTQVFAGTVLIFVSNLIFFPLLGIEATTSANIALVAINTVVAFLKSYFVRAFFRKME